MSEANGDVKKKDMKDVFQAVENIRCVIQKSLKFVDEFLSEPMCGRCLPCSLGSYEAMIRLKRIAAGIGELDDVNALERIGEQMLEGSMCKKGKDTAKFLLDSLKTDSYKEHLEKRCHERECPTLITFRIIPEKCVICGLCKDACRYNAILGEKKSSYLSGYLPFEIRQKRCVKCGDCVKACPYDAIEVIEEAIKAEAEVRV
ncbi:MAG: NADH-ubiquinone oxidoreductase-F iron-sulfur binding region domain-containing protein [Nitrospirota bacterium]